MSEQEIPSYTLGFSPCPNDTFIFHALVHGCIEANFSVTERLEDVETLNRLVIDGELDISKISYHLLGHVREKYALLHSGGALGRGCGPLLVSSGNLPINELHNLPIALPGRFTTASLLLRLFDDRFTNLIYLPFNEIMVAVAEGIVAAGVIIHESRFTYSSHGLVKLLDLGEWWEESSGYPIPLGGIVARRSLGAESVASIDRAISESVAYAMRSPSASRDYIRKHSQEMNNEVCDSHINLYVNDFSLKLGIEGVMAVKALMVRAEAAGIIPPFSGDLFV